MKQMILGNKMMMYGAIMASLGALMVFMVLAPSNAAAADHSNCEDMDTMMTEGIILNCTCQKGKRTKINHQEDRWNLEAELGEGIYLDSNKIAEEKILVRANLDTPCGNLESELAEGISMADNKASKHSWIEAEMR